MKKEFDAKSFNKFLYGILGVIIIITLSVSAYLAVLLNNSSKDMSKNKYLAENNNKKIQTLVKLGEDYNSMSFEADKVENYLPDQKEVSSLLRDLETMATKNGLDFTSYQVGGGQTATKTTAKTSDVQLQSGDGYLIFPFKLSIKGSYVQVDNMMKQIEGFSRLIEIKDIKYTKDYSVSGDIVQVDLTINTYLKK